MEHASFPWCAGFFLLVPSIPPQCMWVLPPACSELGGEACCSAPLHCTRPTVSFWEPDGAQGREESVRGEQESLLCGGQGPHGSQVQWCFSNYIPIKGRPQERHFYETQEPLTAAAPRVRAPQQWPPLCGHTCTQTHTHLLGISVHTLGVYLCVSKINGSLLQAD